MEQALRACSIAYSVYLQVPDPPRLKVLSDYITGTGGLVLGTNPPLPVTYLYWKVLGLLHLITVLEDKGVLPITLRTLRIM